MKKRKNSKVIYKTCALPDKPLIYILRGKDGDMLIDTGWKISVHQIDRWIKKTGCGIKWIFLTHGHYDHIQNALFFQKKYNAKILLHENDVHLTRGEYNVDLIPTDKAYKLAALAANKTAKSLKTPQFDIDIPFSDTDTGLLRTLGFDADIVMLPGHTEGSAGVLHQRVLYCGDACAAKGGDYYTSIFGENLDKLYASEKKIFEINPLVIAPGHGQLIINELAFQKNNV